MTTPIAIRYTSDALYERAKDIAERLGVALQDDASLFLLVSEAGLTLKLPDTNPMTADFHAQTWSRRRDEGKKQGLIKACKPAHGIKIIDATAGWGKDAAILASFGAEVLMIERNPVMALLLEDALQYQSDEDKSRLKLSLHHGSAHDYLRDLAEPEYPDVIYLDPMHPERQKSALVKKEMQVLQSLIGPDDDVFELIQLARQRVKKQVVVKWPQKIAALVTPNREVSGKTVRFDIYLP